MARLRALSGLAGGPILSPVQIQPPRRRAAQAAAILVIAAGMLVLLAGLVPLVGLIIDPPSRARSLIELAVAGLGLAIVLAGRKLLSWGSGQE